MRWTTGATFPAANREYGAAKPLVIPWDFSESPQDNSDRNKKLGRGEGSHFAAFAAFDEETLRATLADGVSGKGSLSSYRLLEPDNWVLRLHEKNGDGEDSVWAHRLIVDDHHEDSKRTNRSTMLVDQCDEQTWAWIRDQWKIVRMSRGATCTDYEVWTNKWTEIKG